MLGGVGGLILGGGDYCDPGIYPRSVQVASLVIVS